jgi:hypothetical protein
VVDDHRVAVGLAVAVVQPALRRGDDEREVLDRPRPQQRFPVRATGRARECRRHAQDLGSLRNEVAVELGEAQIVAHGESQPARRGVDDDGLRARLRVGRLAVALAPARQVDVEEMDLVVARGAPALGVVDDAGVRGTRVALDRDRLRARDDPEAEFAGEGRHCGLCGPVAVALDDGAPLRFVPAHEREVLRQYGEAGAALACEPEEAADGREVPADVRERRHLDGGDNGLRHGVPSAAWRSSFSSRASMRFTWGSSQLPVIR